MNLDIAERTVTLDFILCFLLESVIHLLCSKLMFFLQNIDVFLLAYYTCVNHHHHHGFTTQRTLELVVWILLITWVINSFGATYLLVGNILSSGSYIFSV